MQTFYDDSLTLKELWDIVDSELIENSPAERVKLFEQIKLCEKMVGTLENFKYTDLTIKQLKELTEVIEQWTK